MTPLTLPPDWTALVALLANPVTMGILLSWFLDHVPAMKNPSLANWIKFLLAIALCLLWAFVVTLISTGLPQTPQAIYSMVVLGLAVAFSNQAFFQVVDNLPALRDFLLALFGRPTLGITASSIKVTALPPGSSVVTNTPPVATTGPTPITVPPATTNVSAIS